MGRPSEISRRERFIKPSPLTSKIDEPLDERIIKLTGIEESDLASGTSLEEGYLQLAALHKEYNCFTNPIVWGGGDSLAIHNQLEATNPQFFSDKFFCFGRRWVDIKTIFQMFFFANGWKLQSGLAKSMKRFGMKFEGKKHNAHDDALNTFRLAHQLIQKLKIKG